MIVGRMTCQLSLAISPNPLVHAPAGAPIRGVCVIYRVSIVWCRFRCDRKQELLGSFSREIDDALYCSGSSSGGKGSIRIRLYYHEQSDNFLGCFLDQLRHGDNQPKAPVTPTTTRRNNGGPSHGGRAPRIILLSSKIILIVFLSLHQVFMFGPPFGSGCCHSQYIQIHDPSVKGWQSHERAGRGRGGCPECTVTSSMVFSAHRVIVIIIDGGEDSGDDDGGDMDPAEGGGGHKDPWNGTTTCNEFHHSQHRTRGYYYYYSPLHSYHPVGSPRVETTRETTTKKPRGNGTNDR
jgi:hypothetical protein